jgi:hypothetical protein
MPFMDLPANHEQMTDEQIDQYGESQKTGSFSITSELRAKLRDRLAYLEAKPNDVIPSEFVMAELLRDE